MYVGMRDGVANVDMDGVGTGVILRGPGDVINQLYRQDVLRNHHNWQNGRVDELINLRNRAIDPAERQGRLDELAGILHRGESHWLPGFRNSNGGRSTAVSITAATHRRCSSSGSGTMCGGPVANPPIATTTPTRPGATGRSRRNASRASVRRPWQRNFSGNCSRLRVTLAARASFLHPPCHSCESRNPETLRTGQVEHGNDLRTLAPYQVPDRGRYSDQSPFPLDGLTGVGMGRNRPGA